MSNCHCKQAAIGTERDHGAEPAGERRRCGRAASSAFTLLELLVVMAVVALMIAMLLPAVKRARDTAHAIACQSNLRQIGIGLTTYIDDNLQGVPPVGAPQYPTGGRPAPGVPQFEHRPTRATWVDFLGAPGYIAGARIYDRSKPSEFFERASPSLCPEIATWPTPDLNRIRGFGSTYAFTHLGGEMGYLQGSDEFVWAPSGWMGLFYRGPEKMTDVREPSRVIVATDPQYTAPDFEIAGLANRIPSNGFGYTGIGRILREWPFNDVHVTDRYQHLGAPNTLWGDGSVTIIPSEIAALRTLPAGSSLWYLNPLEMAAARLLLPDRYGSFH